MPTFKVFGDKLVNYYTKVSAENEQDAYDMANAQDSSKWFEIEGDEVITAYQVEPEQDN